VVLRVGDVDLAGRAERFDEMLAEVLAPAFVRRERR
jgi:hypothetical protein